MRNSLYAAVASLTVMLAAEPASACMMMAGLKLEDIKFASVVVIGRIVNYEIARSNDEVSEFWRKSSGRKDVLSDYARFNVLVDEVLFGHPPTVIPVTWDNSTFGEPKEMKEGPYLIALREPGSKIPPLRGPSATVLPTPEPNLMTILQAPCAPAFILEATSAEAKTIRDMLGGAAK